MRKAFLLALIFGPLIVIVSAEAAVPTVEGLFRNSSNPNPQGDFVLFNIMIERLPAHQSLPTIVEDMIPEAESLEHVKDERPVVGYAKFVFSLAQEKKIQLLQVKYHSSSFAINDVWDAYYVNDFDSSVIEDPNFNRAILQSVMQMLALNDSKAIMNVLKGHAPDLPCHDEIINKEKLELLENQKKYLQAIKEDSSLKETLISPLFPEEEAERERVKELLKASMYKRTDIVKLVRENQDFFWQVELSGIRALFSNVSHQLRKLEISSAHGIFEMVFGDYVLFDGVQKMPKLISIRMPDGEEYRVRPLKVTSFVNNGKDLESRAQEYKELATKNHARSPGQGESEASAIDHSKSVDIPLLY